MYRWISSAESESHLPNGLKSVVHSEERERDRVYSQSLRSSA